MNEVSLIPSKDEFNTILMIAENAANSKFFEKLNGKAGIISMALYAREMGLPPMQCLFGGMNNIMGKVEISPRLMNSMIRRNGHKLRIIESTDLVCSISGIRSDTQETYTCTYTIKEAERAGLIKEGGGWKKNPSDMLFARCISRLARRLFPDVIGPAYVEGEVPNEAAEESETIEEAVVEEVKEELISEDKIDFLEELVSSNPAIKPKFLEWANLDSFSEIPLEKFEKSIKAIKKIEGELKKETKKIGEESNEIAI